METTSKDKSSVMATGHDIIQQNLTQASSPMQSGLSKTKVREGPLMCNLTHQPTLEQQLLINEHTFQCNGTSEKNTLV